MLNPQSEPSTPFSFMNSFMAQSNFQSINPNSLCLHPYFSTPQDFDNFRAQAMKFSQMVCNYIAQGLDNVKCELPLKFEGKCEQIPLTAKLEPSDQDLTYSESSYSSTAFSQSVKSLPQADLKPELEKMIRFLLSNMGKGNEALIKSTRNYYLHNSSLLEVYDKISMRFYSAKKCKEDLIRFILRKIFRRIRTSIMKKEKVSSKKASLLMCKRYFQDGEVPSDVEDEEKFLESLMPYNQNSKNKTMNITFILEIFSYESFCKEYQDFLPILNKLITEENKKKEKKLVKFALECIEKNSLEKLPTMHRMPWLDIWMEDAKNLAIAIMPNKRLIYNSKQPRSW